MTEQDPLIFGATNHHPAGCGTPPSLAGLASAAYRGFASAAYRGYFENRYGEQAIFIYDDVRRHGTLYLGDAGWATPYPVVDGRVPDVVLGRDEQAWLRACWRAARAAARP
jgi:hypothetical protein